MTIASTTTSPNVWIIDDQEVRYSIQFALATNGLQVATFGSMEAFLHNVDVNQPGCIILDHQMRPDISATVIDILERAASPIELVLFAAQASVTDVVKLMDRGVAGFFIKPVDPDSLYQKVTAALTRSQARQKVLRAQAILRSLSSREQQIFLAVAQGMKSQAIADKLFLSVRTVEGHRQHIMNKLGGHTPLSLLYDLAHENLIDLGLDKGYKPKKALTSA